MKAIGKHFREIHENFSTLTICTCEILKFDFWHYSEEQTKELKLSNS